MSKWLSNMRRRRAVARRSGTIDPPLVAHALDYFIWAALDDDEFRPRHARPFGDDECHYNSVLNNHFDIDIPSTAMFTEARFGDEEMNIPRYFPDEILGTHTLAKDELVIHRLTFATDTLRRVATAARLLTGRPSLPSEDVLINADGYFGYYVYLRTSGVYFADASRASERMSACGP